ncbi:L-arabinose isomerase [Fusibacter sp. 3D3]|uniref:L-arabinose isomerase n=1 Tax=Fusibacter sp. 3D3 TaxID=1048380 RepID=UPI0008538AAD|nr:L-arabinose isomerase [Fusibacter sp. 3D3]GAU78888.1 L-arabinose isomerase [Fusibacter sp. 3D3]
MTLNAYKFWFIVGSQLLYGPETLAQVEKNSCAIAEGLNRSGNMPWEIEYKGTMKSADEIEKIIKAANYDDTCAGIITFMHTFSPSKMWINGLALLQKPYLHFHTQFNEAIPNEAIDMDYMNLHQSAHGDREHGFIGARMRLPRKVVVGYWQKEIVQMRIGKWMRAAVGAFVSHNMRVMRFGDNMREVAVTEGDKVEAQIKLGWQVNTWPVGQLVATMDAVSTHEIDQKMAEYHSKYQVATEFIDSIRYQAREEIAIQKMMDAEGCMAFSNTFQDLYGMKQLPGLATQNLMAGGYGYAGEGDWKGSALTAIVKAMAFGMTGGTSFMEDYTYDLAGGYSLGSHMLEVCPTLAMGQPRIEVHPLGIGDREAPARLVFEGKSGKAVLTTLIDMGGRFRLVVHDINCVEPTQTMPNLPVARVMWQAEPSLEQGAEAWIRSGGAHHAVLSYDIDAEILCDWARLMGIEYVYINQNTDNISLEHELLLADLVWKLKG